MKSIILIIGNKKLYTNQPKTLSVQPLSSSLIPVSHPMQAKNRREKNSFVKAGPAAVDPKDGIQVSDKGGPAYSLITVDHQIGRSWEQMLHQLRSGQIKDFNPFFGGWMVRFQTSTYKDYY